MAGCAATRLVREGSEARLRLVGYSIGSIVVLDSLGWSRFQDGSSELSTFEAWLELARRRSVSILQRLRNRLGGVKPPVVVPSSILLPPKSGTPSRHDSSLIATTTSTTTNTEDFIKPWISQ